MKYNYIDTIERPIHSGRRGINHLITDQANVKPSSHPNPFYRKNLPNHCFNLDVTMCCKISQNPHKAIIKGANYKNRTNIPLAARWFLPQDHDQ